MRTYIVQVSIFLDKKIEYEILKLHISGILKAYLNGFLSIGSEVKSLPFKIQETDKSAVSIL